VAYVLPWAPASAGVTGLRVRPPAAPAAPPAWPPVIPANAGTPAR